MNDMPMAYQSRGVTESQRDKVSRATRMTDEVSYKADKIQRVDEFHLLPARRRGLRAE